MANNRAYPVVLRVSGPRPPQAEPKDSTLEEMLRWLYEALWDESPGDVVLSGLGETTLVLRRPATVTLHALSEQGGWLFSVVAYVLEELFGDLEDVVKGALLPQPAKCAVDIADSSGVDRITTATECLTESLKKALRAVAAGSPRKLGKVTKALSKLTARLLPVASWVAGGLQAVRDIAVLVDLIKSIGEHDPMGATTSVVLGQWTPVCNDDLWYFDARETSRVGEDARLLTDNLAYQEAFAGLSGPYSETSEWKRSVDAAIAPLKACDADHRLGVAQSVAFYWSDKQDQKALRSSILALDDSNSQFVAVAAGRYHACAVRATGIIDCWGSNRFGQTDAPDLFSSYTDVIAGSAHTCAFTEFFGQPSLKECWGHNVSGQTEVKRGEIATAGGSHNCAISISHDEQSGFMRCWGSNDKGQTDIPRPPLDDRTRTAYSFSAVAAGSEHTCAIKRNGTIACWGSNSSGQADPPPGQYTAISAGLLHTCAISTDQTLACWGRNSSGRTNPPEGQFTAIEAGVLHTCALRTDQSIACWGSNNEHQTDAPEGQYTDISAGYKFSCAITTGKALVCWGDNTHGQTDGPPGIDTTPLGTTVSAGNMRSCGVRSDGTIACWGYNAYGELDAPSGVFKSVSAGGGHHCGVRSGGTLACWGGASEWRLDAPSGVFKSVSVGSGHSCGVRTDSTVACWGSNYDGQSDAPSGAFKSVSAGYEHSCGVRSDSTVACWGANYLGQSDAPSGAFKSVSAGDFHSCGGAQRRLASHAGAPTARGGWTRRRACSSPSPPATVIVVGCAATTPSHAGAEATPAQSDVPSGAFKSVSAGSDSFVRGAQRQHPSPAGAETPMGSWTYPKPESTGGR